MVLKNLVFVCPEVSVSPKIIPRQSNAAAKTGVDNFEREFIASTSPNCIHQVVTLT